MKIRLFFSFILSLIVVCMCMILSNCSSKEEVIENSLPIKLEQPEFFFVDTLTIAAVKQACIYYDIKYPEIVVSQAILETGFFKSENCLKGNNLFGLFNSHTQKFYTFNHWTESVKAYKDLVQYRYKEGDYYTWLQNIGYAEDPMYISKIKNIEKRFNVMGL